MWVLGIVLWVGVVCLWILDLLFVNNQLTPTNQIMDKGMIPKIFLRSYMIEVGCYLICSLKSQKRKTHNSTTSREYFINFIKNKLLN